MFLDLLVGFTLTHLVAQPAHGAKAYAFRRRLLPAQQQHSTQERENRPNAKISVGWMFRLVHGEKNDQQDQADE